MIAIITAKLLVTTITGIDNSAIIIERIFQFLLSENMVYIKNGIHKQINEASKLRLAIVEEKKLISFLSKKGTKNCKKNIIKVKKRETTTARK